MSNIVELNLDDTLAYFEVQDWIDNVFSVQYPYIQATIKKGCQGNCGDKYKEENEQLKKDIIEIEKVSDFRWEENQRLKAQIEKMKCCGNCKYCDSDNPCLFHREHRQCDDYCAWELAE